MKVRVVHSKTIGELLRKGVLKTWVCDLGGYCGLSLTVSREKPERCKVCNQKSMKLV